MSEERRLVALKRWNMVIGALTKKKARIDGSNPLSVRRFSSFGLLKTVPLEKDKDNPKHLWYRYTCPTCTGYSADIRHWDGSFEVEELLGFNNTGNVCVWPSEEVMTYYCLNRREMFKDKAVCELGGGMTCLAGVAVALCTEAKEVLLTDGNEKSVQNIEAIIKRSNNLFEETTVHSRLLRWNDEAVLNELKGTYDYILCADCLFFDDYRQDLERTLSRLLKPQGTVLSFAPRRGDTLQQFKDLAQEEFVADIDENYDSRLWDIHQQNLQKGKEEYDENIHYPILLKLVKQAPADEHKDTTDICTSEQKDEQLVKQAPADQHEDTTKICTIGQKEEQLVKQAPADQHKDATDICTSGQKEEQLVKQAPADQHKDATEICTSEQKDEQSENSRSDELSQTVYTEGGADKEDEEQKTYNHSKTS